MARVGCLVAGHYTDKKQREKLEVDILSFTRSQVPVQQTVSARSLNRGRERNPTEKTGS